VDYSKSTSRCMFFDLLGVLDGFILLKH